jgi:hypothetical protein
MEFPQSQGSQPAPDFLELCCHRQRRAKDGKNPRQFRKPVPRPGDVVVSCGGNHPTKEEDIRDHFIALPTNGTRIQTTEFFTQMIDAFLNTQERV